MHSSLIKCASLSKFCVNRLGPHIEGLLDYESGVSRTSNYVIGRDLCNRQSRPGMDEACGCPRMYYSVFAQYACVTP